MRIAGEHCAAAARSDLFDLLSQPLDGLIIIDDLHEGVHRRRVTHSLLSARCAAPGQQPISPAVA
jgi:hypothetical protein